MIFDWFKRLFKRNQALESASSDSQSLQIDTQALESQALQSASNTENKSVEIQKDSLHLGIAAGYTGRVLRDIEASLNRIETQMVTKDWMTMQVKDDLERRLEIIQRTLTGVSDIADTLPPTQRSQIMEKIQSIEASLPLTPKMLQVMALLQEQKELSYDDLASRLSITVSALRGLLSQMTKRTQKIVRIEKEGKGWLKLVE